MLKKQAEIAEHSIVLVGDFSPQLFQPLWFSNVKLLAKEEIDAAEIAIVHSTVTSFSLSWLKIEVTKKHLMLKTDQSPYYEAVRDLAIGLLQLINPILIRVMGVNFEYHYLVNEKETYKKIWTKLNSDNIFSDSLINNQLKSIALQGDRKDDFDGYIHLVIKPSTLVNQGICYQINDHYILAKQGDVEKQSKSASTAVDILNANWENSFDEAGVVIEETFSKLTT